METSGRIVGAAASPTLVPGQEFSVCVTVTVRIPFLPEFVDADTATGQSVVERDRYVDRVGRVDRVGAPGRFGEPARPGGDMP